LDIQFLKTQKTDCVFITKTNCSLFRKTI
jgi:hypothetical protein